MNLTNANNKGTVPEIFLIISVLFVIALLLPIGYKVFNEVNHTIGPDLGSGGTKAMNTGYAIFSTLDELFLITVVLLAVAGVILAFSVDVHPIFWFFVIFLLAVAVVIMGIFANAYGEVSSNAEFASSTAEFPIMGFIMNNFVEIMVVIAFFIIIIMFAKMRGGE